jgi:hypothetical protein
MQGFFPPLDLYHGKQGSSSFYIYTNYFLSDFLRKIDVKNIFDEKLNAN